MNGLENEKVTVQYVTQRAHCTCCRQKLPQLETSAERHFKISARDVIDWAEEDIWRDISESPEELDDMVREFTYEIISFHAADLSDEVVIGKSELDKVKEFISREVIA